MCIPCPSPKISHFSRENLFLILEYGIRTKNWGLSVLTAGGLSLFLRSLSQKNEEIYVCTNHVYTHIYIISLSHLYLYISIWIDLVTRLSPVKSFFVLAMTAIKAPCKIYQQNKTGRELKLDLKQQNTDYTNLNIILFYINFSTLIEIQLINNIV